MSQRNKEIINQVNAAFAEGKPEKFLALCDENIKWTMVGDNTVKGKDAVRKWMAEMPSEPPQFTVNNVIAEGDFVTAYGDMTMKEKDGKPGSYSYCDVYRLRGDKIVELSSFVIKTEPKLQAAGA
ncbi:MAG: nuclear transport factor 2 family protein [Vicinamibacterales bacterium]